MISSTSTALAWFLWSNSKTWSVSMSIRDVIINQGKLGIFLCKWVFFTICRRFDSFSIFPFESVSFSNWDMWFIKIISSCCGMNFLSVIDMAVKLYYEEVLDEKLRSLVVTLALGLGLKQSCIPCRKLSNNMSHTTWTQGNWVDSQLLVVGSQIANLTPGLSFGHNLCFKCPNGSCEPILDIYVSISFQWYKKLFNPMSFSPCNRFMNIWKSIGTPTAKVETPLGVWRFISSHFASSLGSQPCKPLWESRDKMPFGCGPHGEAHSIL